MQFINLQIFISVTALAWPIFVSIALFFTTIPHTINIRLIPSTMAALFYIITLLIVKITNETLSRTHKINTHIGQSGKRKQGVNVAAVLTNAGSGQKKSSVNIQNLLDSAQGLKTKTNISASAKRLFAGKRKSIGGNPFRMLFSGQRRHTGGGLAKRLYSGKRRRRR
ncbi:MAG: hypothetical protein J1G06_02775 [Oscillospiraceae bacterium]|nr:hypothetical protein [Oscillospiraceae bacterium]